jgi:hypothetical protein
MIIKPTKTLQFENHDLDVFEVNGTRWLGMQQIVAALGVKRQAVQLTYKRHRREFGPDDTDIIVLASRSGAQQTRVFSPRGAMLIAMLSRSEKSERFRAWVLDVLEGKATIAAVPDPAPAAQPGPFAVQVMTEIRQCFVKACGARFIRYLAMDLTTAELKKLTGYTAATIARKRRTAEALGLVEVKSPLLAERRAKAASRLIPGGPRKNPLTLVTP